jgi:flagellin
MSRWRAVRRPCRAPGRKHPAVGLRINTNIMSLQAQRHLHEHTRRVNRAMERLASGLRINRASDDPAGLAISERLESQIAALDVVGRNAADGISLVQTAEGGLEAMGELLLRMKELAVQSSTGTLDDAQRSYLEIEFVQLGKEVERIASATEFNGHRLLDGSLGALNLHVGIGDKTSSDLVLDFSFDASAVGTHLDDVTIGSVADALDATAAIDGVIGTISSHRASMGAAQNRLESVIRQNANLAENLAAANSRIRDADIAVEMSNLTSRQIMQQAAVAILGQANSQPNLILALLDRSRLR